MDGRKKGGVGGEVSTMCGGEEIFMDFKVLNKGKTK